MNKIISKQALDKLILDSLLKIKEDNEPNPEAEIKYSSDGIPMPSNSGEAVEYLFAYYLAIIDSQKVPQEGSQNPEYRENQAIFTIPGVQKGIKADRILNSITESGFDADSRLVIRAVMNYFSTYEFKKQVKQDDYITEIILLGKSEGGSTSADLQFYTKKGIRKKTSLKKAQSGSQLIYQTGQNDERGYNFKLKDEGGGILKLYNIFSMPNPPNLLQFKNDSNSLFDRVSADLNKKFSKKQNIPIYLNTVMRLIQRDDPEVELLQSIYKGKIIYPKLLEKFFNYIQKIKHYRVDAAKSLPYIKVKFVCDESFSIEDKKDISSSTRRQLETDLSKSLDNIKKIYKNLYTKYSKMEDKQKKQFDDTLKNIGLKTPLEKDFTSTYKALKDFIEKNLKNINSHDLIQIRQKEDGINYIEKLAGLQYISDVNEFFENLESKKEYNSFVLIILEIFKMHESISKAKSKKLDEFIIQNYKNFLLIKENKQNILNKIKKKINSLNKEDLGIISVTPSNKSEAALVVRCKDKEDIESTRSAVKSAIDDMGISANNRVIAKFEPSTESTEVQMNDGSGGVYIVYKYDTGSREGLALEHVMGLLLTKKVTPELKNRLDLPPEASKEEVKEKLKTDYADVLSTAFKGKKLIDQKIGEITDARSEGSRNSKADLILTTADGHIYGLSIKLVTEQGREVRFTYNKNLGYGDDEEDTLVKSPNGRPWWLIGRQNFAKKLGRQFKGNPEDLEPPSWMTKAKESKSDLYKEAMEETYAALREVFVDNLRRMKLKELVDMVNEAHTGGEQEEEYEKLFVLTSDVDGIRLEAKGHEQPDVEKIKMSGVNKSDIVKTDGARIIIEIPGMSPLTIHGLKFHSNMLSSNREDLKIKTR